MLFDGKTIRLDSKQNCYNTEKIILSRGRHKTESAFWRHLANNS